MHDLNEFITFNRVIYTHFIETWWNISGYYFCHWKGNTKNTRHFAMNKLSKKFKLKKFDTHPITIKIFP